MKDWLNKKLIGKYGASIIRKVLFGAGVLLSSKVPGMEETVRILMENIDIISAEILGVGLASLSVVWGLKEKVDKEKTQNNDKKVIEDLLGEDKQWVAHVKTKKEVSLHRLDKATLKALEVAVQLHASMGLELVVTSTFEGQHSQTSNHPLNRAFDTRIWSMSKTTQVQLAAAANKILGKEYDVLVEKDHIHWEHDKKTIKS